MLNRAKLIAFGATTNPVSARQFYESVLGLKVVADDAFAIEVDANGTTLRIQKVEKLTPPPFTSLGWEVSDIDVAVKALHQKGVAFQSYAGMGQDERGIWRSPSGAKVAWFQDPDGNTLSLTELTKLSYE